MSILNFGSCCIDNVYSVPHFVKPGETLSSLQYEVHPGGKGLNQSIAMAAGGAHVRHAGKIGADGAWLADLLADKGVDVACLNQVEGPSGHANIQVTPQGENAIVLFGGTNRDISERDVDAVLETASAGEFLVLQNEISSLAYLMTRAHEVGMRIVLNAAPMTPEVAELPLSTLELLIINEVEGQALTGEQVPDSIIRTLSGQHPTVKVLLTLGADGAIFSSGTGLIQHSAETVEAVDTTGAGDTFTGFFMAAYERGETIYNCLDLATKAAAICVTRRGAATSIPTLAECR